MRALFVLLPAAADADAVFAGVLATHGRALRLRKYPRAMGSAHLLSLVRDGRDPIATRWLRGTVAAVLGGGVLGAIVNGVLAHFFGMFGGLLDLALPLGFLLGAFLGGFTSAMTGTQVARYEVKRLAKQVRVGDVLLQWTGTPDALAAVAARCEDYGLATTRVT